ncbi:MAG: hypothetical protein U1F54_18985 [Burkholderiales bacterium]
MRRIPRSLVRAATDAGVMVFVITLALVFLVSPNPFTFSVPPGDIQDGLAHGLLIKTIMEVGWYPISTSWIGAPFGTALYDYPFSDGLNFLLIKLFGMASSDWVVVANLFFIAGFYLSGLTAYAVFRRLGVARVWSVVGGILFAFLPYHLLRREHLLLASYFTVPLGVLLAWFAWRGTGLRSWRARHVAPWVLLVAAAASGGVYYAFFSAALIALMTAARMLKTRSLRAGAPGAAMVAGIAFFVLLNVLPSLVFWSAEGPNPEVAVRAPIDSEIYGLRLTQMMAPHPQHRIDALRDIAHAYTKAPLVNENRTAALGFVGCAGLLLLGLLVLQRLAGVRRVSSRESFLATMGAGAFMIGTIGGAGAVFAYTISPMIRGYNRISVAIAFVAFTVLFVALQRFVVRMTLGKTAVAAIAIAIVLGGLLDQTPRQDGPPIYTYPNDRAFMARAEAALPPGTMVWQMPYQPFPESWWVHRMPLYSPLRGYLNSENLRWSYGAVRGREADRWIRGLSSRPVEDQIELAARSGFGAVYIDRRGFPDEARVMKLLRERLGPPIAESIDGDIAMFRMTPTGTRPLLLGEVDLPVDIPIELYKPNPGPLVKDMKGFSGWEPWGRWTNESVAKIELIRPLPLRFLLRIETITALGPTVQSGLYLRVGGFERRFEVGPGPTVVEIPVAHSTSARSIEILVPRPATPLSLGLNDDERTLGVGIKSITILPPVGS